MNLQLYKPNSKNTGCAISFQISQKGGNEPQFYVNCIAQHSWDDSRKTGSFAGSRDDPSKTVAVKFNEFELGELINSFDKEVSYSTFHSNESTKTRIMLSTYDKTRGTGDYAIKVKCFGLTIVRNGSDQFKVPIEPGEAVRLKSFINKFFSILDDYRGTQFNQDKNQKPSVKNSNPPKTSQPQAEPEVEDDGHEF